nr:MAG TPA: hypothetical protein [Inoviridae sp.]
MSSFVAKFFPIPQKQLQSVRFGTYQNTNKKSPRI